MAGGVGSQSQLRCGHKQLAGLEVLTEENHGICCRNFVLSDKLGVWKETGWGVGGWAGTAHSSLTSEGRSVNKT